MKDKIKFKDLSGWLKFAAISTWVIVGYWAFLIIVALFAVMLFY